MNPLAEIRIGRDTPEGREALEFFEHIKERVMKKTYRNGEYTMDLSPNENQWLVHKGKKCVATLDVEWIEDALMQWHNNPLILLVSFLEWYYSF